MKVQDRAAIIALIGGLLLFSRQARIAAVGVVLLIIALIIYFLRNKLSRNSRP